MIDLEKTALSLLARVEQLEFAIGEAMFKLAKGYDDSAFDLLEQALLTPPD